MPVAAPPPATDPDEAEAEAEAASGTSCVVEGGRGEDMAASEPLLLVSRYVLGTEFLVAAFNPFISLPLLFLLFSQDHDLITLDLLSHARDSCRKAQEQSRGVKTSGFMGRPPGSNSSTDLGQTAAHSPAGQPTQAQNQ